MSYTRNPDIRDFLASLLQCVMGRNLCILQWYCHVEGNRGPCAMGFRKSLQHQSLGIQRKFLQCLGLLDWGMCQRSSAKIVARCFHNKMVCPELSVCHHNTLGLLMAQCSFKSHFFHLNPDKPWFHCAKTKLVL